MMRESGWISPWLRTAFLLLTLDLLPGPARAQVVLLPAAESRPALMVHGIPLPPGAEPFLAANLSLENLHAMAPRAGELGRGWLRAVVYHMQPGPLPDQVASYYQSSVPGTTRLRARAPAPGARPNGDDGTRVLQLASPSRLLAIRTEEPTGRGRITVALYQGTAAPGVVLDALDSLRNGPDGPPPAEAHRLLSARWQEDTSLEGPRLQILQRNLKPGNQSDPITDIVRSLLTQAQRVRVQSYTPGRIVPATEMLQACVQESARNRWQLLSVEAEAGEKVMALYRLSDDGGMVMLRADRPQVPNAGVRGSVRRPAPSNSTEISRLEVTGRIRLQSLFRPTQPAPAPPVAVPFVVPPRRAPFSAQPR